MDFRQSGFVAESFDNGRLFTDKNRQNVYLGLKSKLHQKTFQLIARLSITIIGNAQSGTRIIINTGTKCESLSEDIYQLVIGFKQVP